MDELFPGSPQSRVFHSHLFPHLPTCVVRERCCRRGGGTSDARGETSCIDTTGVLDPRFLPMPYCRAETNVYFHSRQDRRRGSRYVSYVAALITGL